LDPLTIQRWVSNGMEWAVMILPLAIYFLIFGLFINRRRHPVVLRGSWNVFWLALAGSAFFLIGPPSWLVQPFRAWGLKVYWSAYGGYIAILVWGCLVWMRRERRSLVIVNHEPAQFVELLPKALAELNVSYAVTPGRVSFAEGKLVLDLESSSLFRSVTLEWKGEETSLQAQIEDRLIRALRESETPEHPGGMMLAFCGILLFSFVLFASVLYATMLITLHLTSF
jgi:hypothetical protein